MREPTENEKNLYSFFLEILPYYNSSVHDVPASLRLAILLNKWPNAAIACNDIANHILVNPKLKKDAARRLCKMQSFGEV